MRKEVAMKWVGFLRSGDFQQTYGRLRREEPYKAILSWGDEPAGHCCMGVLCELAAAEGIIEGFLSSDIYLPEEVWTWAGTDGNNPVLSFPVEESPAPESVLTGLTGVLQLTELNDSKEWSFERIADLIEERWEEL